MSRRRRTVEEATAEATEQWHDGPDVPMTVIRQYVRKIVERFQPEKVILFGSRAYGVPHSGSDVDILVVMPTRSEINQAWKIDATLPRNFSLHLIVRTPNNIEWRLREGDWFLREIIARGRVLYEKTDSRVGAQGRRRLSSGAPARRGTRSIS
jgi:predicted nucleotidyltransferase